MSYELRPAALCAPGGAIMNGTGSEQVLHIVLMDQLVLTLPSIDGHGLSKVLQSEESSGIIGYET